MFGALLVPRLFALPVSLDLANIAGWTLQGLGQAAGFWGRVPWWDTLVHLVLPRCSRRRRCSSSCASLSCLPPYRRRT